MPKIVAPLTDTKVRNAKPRDKGYKLSDGGGLHLYVSLHGTKSWRFKYRDLVTKKEKVITFGTYPSLSLADARALRDEAKKGLLTGKIQSTAHRDKASTV